MQLRHAFLKFCGLLREYFHARAGKSSLGSPMVGVEYSHPLWVAGWRFLRGGYRRP